jgi:hypothetical protein
MAVLVLAGLCGLLIWPAAFGTARKLCIISDGHEVRWAANSARPKVGDAVLRSSFQLESGAVELTFASTARVAIQGPARFKLLDGNSMELQEGSISAEVPVRARGFSVTTPSASVVDLGTRFGASVNSNLVTEVDVFQGHVQVAPATNGGAVSAPWRLAPGMAVSAQGQSINATTPLPDTAFPQPGQIVYARPQNCGFDGPGHTIIGEVPTAFGSWSGPAYVLTGPTEGIRPHSGKGMLQFLCNTSAAAADSEVWQVVDMQGFKALLASGSVEAKLSAYFNRIAGAARQGEKFGLTLAAFHGPAADAPSLWARRATAGLAVADTQLTADNNPATWEKIEVSAKLPAETDFVIVGLRAIAPKTTSAKAPPLPGHFADLVDLKLCTPMRPATSSARR